MSVSDTFAIISIISFVIYGLCMLVLILIKIDNRKLRRKKDHESNNILQNITTTET